MQRHTYIILTSCFLLLLWGHAVFADHDNYREKHHNEYLTPVNNETYRQECGTCHFAYQPGLLPSGSWGKILANLPAHFGEEVSLNQGSMNIISEYLQKYAGENSSAKRARKILKSLKGQTPLRITETPYIREKHHELDPDIFRRPAVGSFANCVACHTTAEQGNYDDDFVRIPE